MQFTRTIQNYQKAYRKKVEGLKTELKTSRTANTRLSKQVKRLKSFKRLHVPSIAVGALVCYGIMKLWGLRRQKKEQPPAAPQVADVAEPGTPDEHQHL
eukprot:365377-Chlamydomonas_euryale.AAC.36